ncbi:MAG: hypothetical protein R3E90_11875 [Marinicella sp.]|nr:hypothetical protein [Xanthomonadales bacterium]
MNRRNFNKKSLLGVLGLSASAPILAEAIKSPEKNVDHLLKLKGKDGLVLHLRDKQFATKNQDNKQYILTYDVLAGDVMTEEMIYDLIDNRGKKVQLFMKPVGDGQLQAVFNQRTHA